MTETDEQKKERRKREIEISDTKAVLKTVEGKRLLWRILDKAGIGRSVFASSGGNRELTDFYCGKQDIGLWLQSEILDADPNGLVNMQRINESREKMDEIDKEDQIEQKTVLTRS